MFDIYSQMLWTQSIMIHAKLKYFIFGVFTSISVANASDPGQFTVNSSFCDRVLNGKQSAGSIETVLKEWIPDGLLGSKYPTDFQSWDGVKPKVFGKLFEVTSHLSSDLLWYPFSFFSGGLRNPVSPEALVGHVVAGFFYDAGKVTIGGEPVRNENTIKDFIHPLGNNDSFFYWGTIVGVRDIGPYRGFHDEQIHQYLFTIRGPDQIERKIFFVDQCTESLCTHSLFVLGNKRQIEATVKATLDLSNILDHLRVSLNRNVTKDDIEVLKDIFTLYESLPANHGRTSVVKNLLGQETRVKHKTLFGKLHKNKIYKSKTLNEMAILVEFFLSNSAGMVLRDLPQAADDNKAAPHWIYARDKRELKISLPIIIEWLDSKKIDLN